MQEKMRFAIRLLCLSVLMQYCATTDLRFTTPPFHIYKSLPQSKLAYYNDTFERMREDLWAKSALVHTKGQLSNFKIADIRVENGKLWVETKTGCLSEGGLVFKHVFRGDFDIQVDCHIDLLGGVLDMDQLVVFGAVEKAVDLKKINSMELAVLKRGEWQRGVIFSFQRISGKMHKGKWHKLDRFHGSLRIIRKGNKGHTLYRLEGKPKWKTSGILGFTTNDVLVGFFLQNYVLDRTSIRAETAISAYFDNFIINAAQGIVEEDI